MHIAMMADEERLAIEQAMLNRLAVALIDDGAQLTRLVPEGLAGERAEQEERNVALASRVPVPMRVLPWMHQLRARRLAVALQRAMPDVLYAAGERAWRVAIELSHEIDRPVALEVWRLGQVRSLPRRHRARRVSRYVVPTEALAEALGRRVRPELISIVPMGVSVPAHPRPILQKLEHAVALAVIGSCSDVTAYRSVFSALAMLVKQYPQVQVFLELRGRRQHEIWRIASRLGLLANVSAISNAAIHRALLTRCDAMILPERLGEVRSLLLEAMAGGLPIIAGDDPIRDMLRDGETAWIVPQPTIDGWLSRLQALLVQPDRARELGLAGRARVSARHRSSDHARTLVASLEVLAEPPAATLAGTLL